MKFPGSTHRVLITNSHDNAYKWKHRIAKYLQTTLKIELSDEKTKITNVRKKAITFLGINIKQVRGKSKSGYIIKSRPNSERLQPKIKKLHQQIKEMKLAPTKEAAIRQVEKVNSVTRGLIQYYQMATCINIELAPYSFNIQKAAYQALKRFGVKWVTANQTANLYKIHKNYTTKIPALKYQERSIGVTSITFCRWKMAKLKNDAESIYTENGRNLYRERTGKARKLPRDDIILEQHTSKLAEDILYNFEYYLNRGYALNRDRKKCRICKKLISADNVHWHHINPKLPINRVNRVPNLATVHWECHVNIHDEQVHTDLGKTIWDKILHFRNKLQ